MGCMPTLIKWQKSVTGLHQRIIMRSFSFLDWWNIWDILCQMSALFPAHCKLFATTIFLLFGLHSIKNVNQNHSMQNASYSETHHMGHPSQYNGRKQV